MFEAYSLLEPADAIITHRLEVDDKHGRLVNNNPVIVRNADGTIDGDKSYVTVIEQTSVFKKNAPVSTTFFVNQKYTFNNLFNTGYIPVTCSELVTGLYEKPEISITPEIKASDITGKEKFTNMFESNYNIVWVKVEVIDSNNNTIYSQTKFPTPMGYAPYLTGYPMASFNESLTFVSSLKGGEYTYNISALIRDEVVAVDSIKFTK